MSFIPSNLDQQALPAVATSTPSSLLTTSTDSVQSLAPRPFNDPSYLMEINAIRAKVAAKTHTKEDMTKLVKLIRETRGQITSSNASPGSKPTKAGTPRAKPGPKPKPDGQALLDLL